MVVWSDLHFKKITLVNDRLVESDRVRLESVNISRELLQNRRDVKACSRAKVVGMEQRSSA